MKTKTLNLGLAAARNLDEKQFSVKRAASKSRMLTVPLLALLATTLSMSAAADPAIAFVARHSVTVGHGNNAVTTTYDDLTVMNADGSSPTVLLTRTSTAFGILAIEDPAWSPDLDGNPANGYQGCLAVVIADSATDVWQAGLYVLDVTVSGGVPQASNLRRIVDAAVDPSVGSSVFQPEWSSDLDSITPGYQGKIAFIGSTDGGSSGSVNLVSMVWDGVTAQLVGPPSSSVVLYDGHPTGGLPFHPTWSPDGARIAVSSDYLIQVLDAATGSVASSLNASPIYLSDLQWSRTSSRVVLRDGNTQKLYTVNVDAGIASLAPVTVASSSGSRHPTWSPDDSSLAFANLGSAKGSKWNVVRMNLSTGAQTVLVSGSATGRDLLVSHPDWRRF